MCPAECDNTTKSQHCSTRLPWPEEKKGGTIFSYFHRMYQRWTFSYMNLIFSRNSGDRQSKLVQEDLFGVPSAMRADVLKERFSGKYKECSRHKILNTMWHVASPTLVPAGFCELITVACQVSMPLLVRELLSLVENNPSGDIARKGFPFALSIFAVMVVNAFGNHRHRHLALKSGVAMRAALVSALYDHILDLSPLGRTGLKSGEIANLVAVDTQKLFDVAQDFHLIWALPLSIIVVTIFLVIVMGPVTLIGIAVLVLLVPVVERVTSKMLKVRQKRVSITDERVGVVNSMLQGIKVTKLGNYERNYETRILDIRKNELRELKVELAIWALTLVIVVISPILASSATFAAYVLIDDKNILTASDTFSVLLLFSALRFPINYAGQLAGKAVQAFSAMYRIRLFLEREAQTLSSFSTDDNEQALTSSVHPLTVRNASFSPVGGVDDGTGVEDSLQAGKETFSVSMFDFSVRKGEILAVYGPVASGKSTLINGILGEAKRLEGDVSIHGRIAVVPQSPFILNASFRDNILFGREFDSSLYEQVIQSCCLVADIQQLGESADQTEIGERGVTLSGGQKQRISIARAAYAQPDLVLLDDPLSALDATVSSIVFENVLKSPNALFRDTAVVLVTHASHFLSRVDNVLVIAEGKNAFIGTWKDLATFQPADPKVKDVVKFLRSSLQEQVGDDRNAESLVVMRGENEMVSHKLMSEEEREHGLSSLMVWTLWFRRAGGYWFLSTQVFFMAIDRFAYVATEYWLAKWTQGASKEVSMAGISFPPQTDGKSAQYKFLLVYSILILVSILTTLIRSEWAVTGGAKAAKTVFSSMLTGVLRAPMSYFEQTPMGRILNRFTYDVDVVDVSLTQSMSMFMISCSWYIAGVIVMCTILPWSALAIFPVTSLYWLLMLHYRRTGADLQRLDAVSRSPIQAMVNEGVEGSTTIRAFRKQPEFIEKFRRATDDNSSALLNFVSAQRWLGLRIELLGSMVVLTSSMAVVLFNSTFKIEPGLVGLLIMWSSNFTITLGFLVDTFSATEAAITAIERVDAMAKVPSEKAMETLEPFIPPEDWPRSGKLCFENVCLRYRDGLPLALNELTFTVQGGTRCGIVGRTGAGKSSITVALFRIAEIESGRITLDGLDLGLLGLCDVRGRQNGMTIIPQDPFLTGSTLRECIDPFRAFSDSDVLNALQTVRLVTSHATIEVLGTRVEEGGSNYSVGERQLMNIAHALLSKPRILVLDEATGKWVCASLDTPLQLTSCGTASVDGETDAFIQGMLRTKFPSSTLLTVAHRLHTVMDYDTIIVMKDGRSVEEGHPAELLSRRGAFADLVNATGEENAKALRALIGHSSSGI